MKLRQIKKPSWRFELTAENPSEEKALWEFYMSHSKMGQFSVTNRTLEFNPPEVVITSIRLPTWARDSAFTPKRIKARRAKEKREKALYKKEVSQHRRRTIMNTNDTTPASPAPEKTAAQIQAEEDEKAYLAAKGQAHFISGDEDVLRNLWDAALAHARTKPNS